MDEGIGVSLGDGPRAIRAGCPERAGSGRFEQELAAANDRTSPQLGARVELAGSARFDLLCEAVQAILDLRREVEFWRLVAGGPDRVEVARLAGCTAVGDAAGSAVPDHGTNRSATDQRGNYADLDALRSGIEKAGIAGMADLANCSRTGKPAGLAGHAGSTDLAGPAAFAGNVRQIGGDHHRRVTDAAGATAVSPAGPAVTAEPAGSAGKAGTPIGGSG